MSEPPRRIASTRAAVFWTSVVLAVAAVVGGAVLARAAYRDRAAPDDAVRGYFAALARSDAPAALGYGELPDAAHPLLTGAVLAEQQRIAPIDDVRISNVAAHGDRATVRYSYRLRFPRAAREFTGTLELVRRSAGWRLTRSAVSTTIRVTAAGDRVSLAGAALPDGPALVFPGAVPLRLDTPYLQADPGTATVQFGAPARTDVQITVSAAAGAAMRAALGRRLDACVAARTSGSGCPPPGARLVPGSLAGHIVGGLGALQPRLQPGAAGTLSLAGVVTFRGRYQALDYQNIVHARSGTLTLRVRAAAYAVRPLQVRLEAMT